MITSEGEAPGLRQRRPGVAQACVVCYQKKIRCDLTLGKTSCSNCALYRTECRPRLRKRKKTLSSQIQPDEQNEQISQQNLPSPRVTMQMSPSASSTRSQGQASWSLNSPTIDSNMDAGDFINVQGSTPKGGGLPEVTEAEASIDQQANIDNDDGMHTSPASCVHDGRAVYFADIASREVESTEAYPHPPGLSPLDMANLQANHAFEYPSRAVQSCYIDNFFQYCYPWVPIVERPWLEDTNGKTPSPLLMQAVMLAGSRVTSPIDHEASRELYNKAKVLFYSNYEKNHITLIIACLLLQWWNPAGPERLSLDSSSFWERTGVGIALQIGLHKRQTHSPNASYRRRLWWALVARDCQISTGHCRPSAITMGDSDIPPITPQDFPSSSPHALAFIHFVRICQTFGDLGASCRKGKLTEERAGEISNSLYVWIRELPPQLRLFRPLPDNRVNTYCLASRQIHVFYFTTLALLFRKSSSNSTVSTGSLLASSFIAAIFEEFLIRDEIRFLGPAIYKFNLLTAGITLIQALKVPSLHNKAKEDLDIIKRSLEQFAKRVPSSLATIHTLNTLEQAQEDATEALEGPLAPTQYESCLFREFGPGMCRQWHLMESSTITSGGPGDRPPDVHESGVQGIGAVGANAVPDTQFGDFIDLHRQENHNMTDDMEMPWSSIWPTSEDPMTWILDEPVFNPPG